VSELLIAPAPIRVVLADANVLYPRVLRDYLLYAAEQGVISVVWSLRILDEMTRHLIANIPGFTEESAQRLIAAMTETFPDSTIDLSPSDFTPLASFRLRDEDDRHVMVAALKAEADIICTDNTADFPAKMLASLGVTVLSADELLSHLIREAETQMVRAHRDAVALFSQATNESTIAALTKAGAPTAASLMAKALRKHAAKDN
jgi:predicted nucleic acid-binding protein